MHRTLDVSSPEVAPHVWGVIGGMGPVASAEFLRTIYACCRGPEQQAPIVVVDSDPTFPDRTHCLQQGLHATLAARLERSLARLTRLGASEIVICCMTIHAVLPLVRERLRRRVLSLPDVILGEVASGAGTHLLLCTDGTRESGLFEGRPLWPVVRDQCVLPDAGDQQRIHALIYAIKANDPAARASPLLKRLRTKYGVASLIAGCTEMHVVARHGRQSGSAAWIDPLLTIAQRMAGERDTEARHPPGLTSGRERS